MTGLGTGRPRFRLLAALLRIQIDSVFFFFSEERYRRFIIPLLSPEGEPLTRRIRVSSRFPVSFVFDSGTRFICCRSTIWNPFPREVVVGIGNF